MRCAFFHPSTGEVVQTAAFPGGADVAQELADAISCDWIELAENEAVSGIAYVQDGQLRLAGQPPAMHAWDWQTRSWKPDFDAAKAAMRQAIEAERERRIYARVIVYDGKNVDADAWAQRNISEKLNDIARREQEGVPMPVEMLMWRDADNVDHQFADQAAYRSWLNGLAIALGLRGTQAYAWSWGKKAQLDALGDDLEALAGFEPTT
jgi:hypothetical protein